MRVLVCSPRAPADPTDGLRLILDNVLPRLREDIDIRVLALGDEPWEGDSAWGPVRVIARPPSRIDTVTALARATLTGRPLRPDDYARRCRSPLEQELRLSPPQCVLVFSPLIAPLGRRLQGWPSVLSVVDAWHRNAGAYAGVAHGVRKLHLAAECGRIRRFEASEYRWFDEVVTVSDADRAALARLDPHLDVTVIGNGVDTLWFAPTGQAPDRGLVVFHGAMGYAPNVTAAQLLAREIMPAVREHAPHAHLAIVGRDPAPEIRQLAEDPAVHVTGEVDDVRPWLRRAAVYACPMVAGTGVKNKLLEAMACGAACVATPLAIQGTAARDGTHLLVRKADDVAAAIGGLLLDLGRGRELGRAARSYVVNSHDWDDVADQYGRLLASVSRRPDRIAG